MRIAGTGSMQLVDYPPDRKRIEIGSIEVSDQRLRMATGWRPNVDLKEGLTRMVAYYRAHGQHYLSEDAG